MNRPKGFSLIELLVVIAIIGLLSTMAVVSLNNARQKARDSRRMSDIKQLQQAIELYKTDQSGTSNDVAPQVATGGGAVSWATLGTTLANYLPSGLPSDPGGNAYVYCSEITPGLQSKFLVGAVLETTTATAGDVDGTTSGYASTECINSKDAGTGYALAVPNCSDSTGQLYGGTANQNAYCLGYTN